MVDISLLPLGSRASVVDGTGKVMTGTIVGRLSGGVLEGDVDQDEWRNASDPMLQRVKLRFVDRLGPPPETISISCDPRDVTLPE